MKINQLDKINICGYVFKIEWDKTHSGGSFFFNDRTIIIGSSRIKTNVEITFMILMHELSEIIHLIINTRYQDPSCDTNYKFFLDHKEFENHNTILSSVLTKFIK